MGSVMTYLEWDRRLETGQDTIDVQHKDLVACLVRAHDAVAEGNGPAEVTPLIEDLVKSLLVHYDTEERMMKSTAYANTARHVQIHQDTLAMIRDLADRFSSGGLNLSGPVMEQVKGWLVSHIQNEDVQFVDFLRRG
jgi:hemerythrin-like metal-binding protein